MNYPTQSPPLGSKGSPFSGLQVQKHSIFLSMLVIVNVSWWFIRTFLKTWHTNTHSVVFFDVSTDVKQQFVADVDRVVNGPTLTGDVAASHQAGLQVQSLEEGLHGNINTITAPDFTIVNKYMHIEMHHRCMGRSTRTTSITAI